MAHGFRFIDNTFVTELIKTKHMRHLVAPMLLLSATMAQAQNVGINPTGVAPDGSAMLDVSATDRGMLVPRLALTALNAPAPVAAPAASLLVYNTATAGVAPNNVTPGYYYWSGAPANRWIRFAGDGDAWRTTGNAGTVAATNFLGTTDAVALRIRTENFERFGITAGTAGPGGAGGRLQAFHYGTAGSPVYSWSTDPNMGLFRQAANTLGFSTTSAERMRIEDDGQIIVPGMAPVGATDLFTARGTALQPYALNGYAGAGAAGVWGQGLANADGVVGVTNAAGTNGFGVFAANGNNAGAGLVAYGLVPGDVWVHNGSGVSATGYLVGAAAYGESATSYGIKAAGNNLDGGAAPPATGGGGYLVGSVLGAYGRAQTAANGIGVLGTGNNIAAFTLANGAGGAFSGTRIAAYGVATDLTLGVGVVASGNNQVPIVPGNGAGGAFTGDPQGVYARGMTAATGLGIMASGNGIVPTTVPNGGGGSFRGTLLGAIGSSTTAADGTGLVGLGNNQGTYLTLTNGSGVAGTGTNFGVYGVAISAAAGAAGAPARAGGYFVSGSGSATETFTYVAAYEGAGVPRKVMGDGTVNTVVRDLDDNYVLLSAPEAPENLFQDYGTGQLVNGKARIDLDPILSKNILVNDEHPLRVFVQLRGDCNGVYVTNETATSFEVVELMGGTSNAPFFWTVTANRANTTSPSGIPWNYAEERFARTMGPQTVTTATLVPVVNKEVEQTPAGTDNTFQPQSLQATGKDRHTKQGRP